MKLQRGQIFYLQTLNSNLEKIDFQKVLDFADESSERGAVFIRVYETSSRTGQNVEKLFTDVARDHLDDPKNNLNKLDQTLKVKAESKENMKKCCLTKRICSEENSTFYN